MYSKYTKNYEIKKDFEKVFSNFTKAILFYKPKDIIDFAINYFTSLEQKVPLEKILKNKKYSNIVKTESTLQNEENISEEENTDLNDTNNNNIEDSNDEQKIRIPLTKEFEELIETKDIENKNKIAKNNINKEIIENNIDRNKVKEFISDLFKI